ncbi:MAG: HPr kinase/phosphatase C-terminal domain-containing protein [Sulfitobacter sp.]|jgi:HPr kinase/phosphorylase|nr:HPr kinase/phosphatase C-terminal domain-containing protein [Sulfitobacter sp.]
MDTSHAPQIIHATCVSLHGHGVLIIGASGSGKSSLALQLMAMGAGLVADDRTCLQRQGAGIVADVPETIKGLIEARGIGVLKAQPTGPVPVAVVIDLDQTETQRLPDPHAHRLLGVALPCLYNIPAPHFAAAILQYLKGIIGI